MTLVRPGGRIAEAEYLDWEDAQPDKHELVNGEVVAMSGASYAHNRVVMNLIGALLARLRGGPCRVNGSDLRVHVDETGLYAYPDLTVVCGPPQLTERSPPSLLNPRVIVEVLSPSTASYDLGAKAAHYRRRASIETILFVDCEERRVQRQDRNADGSWTLREQVEGEVELAGARIPIEEIYEEVAFREA